MIIDIFSSFDPYIYSSLFPSLTLIWLLSIIIIFIPLQKFWVNSNIFLSFIYSIASIIYRQLIRTKISSIKRFSSLLIPIFFIIIIFNLLGLLPYIFRTSRHLIITISIGLPLWISIIISSFYYNFYSATALLIPSGAPRWLNPFLVLVETLSTLVRPLTLSFRLAANITAGHVVLGLIGSYLSSSLFSSMLSISTIITFLVGILYIIFEIGICLIQAYIFSLLLTLYSDDHS